MSNTESLPPNGQGAVTRGEERTCSSVAAEGWLWVQGKVPGATESFSRSEHQSEEPLGAVGHVTLGGGGPVGSGDRAHSGSEGAGFVSAWPQQSHGDCLSLPSEKRGVMLPSTTWHFLGVVRRQKSPGWRVLGSGFQVWL